MAWRIRPRIFTNHSSPSLPVQLGRSGFANLLPLQSRCKLFRSRRPAASHRSVPVTSRLDNEAQEWWNLQPDHQSGLNASDCSLPVDSSLTGMPPFLGTAGGMPLTAILSFAASSTGSASVGTTHSNTCQARSRMLAFMYLCRNSMKRSLWTGAESTGSPKLSDMLLGAAHEDRRCMLAPDVDIDKRREL